jgi:capsular polysaccharide biosynthesis protein
MEDSNTLIIIISVAAAAVIGIGIFFLLRFLRGTIKIQLPVTAFSPAMR